MNCQLCPIDKKPNEGKRKLWGESCCDECYERINKLDLNDKPKGRPRDTRPQSMKDEGAKYFNSTVQPRREGIASQEYIEAYPEQAETEFTAKERLTARHVWKDVKGWKNRDKSL